MQQIFLHNSPGEKKMRKKMELEKKHMDKELLTVVIFDNFLPDFHKHFKTSG